MQASLVCCTRCDRSSIPGHWSHPTTYLKTRTLKRKKTKSYKSPHPGVGLSTLLQTLWTTRTSNGHKHSAVPTDPIGSAARALVSAHTTRQRILQPAHLAHARLTVPTGAVTHEMPAHSHRCHESACGVLGKSRVSCGCAHSQVNLTGGCHSEVHFLRDGTIPIVWMAESTQSLISQQR